MNWNEIGEHDKARSRYCQIEEGGHRCRQRYVVVLNGIPMCAEHAEGVLAIAQTAAGYGVDTGTAEKIVGGGHVGR